MDDLRLQFKLEQRKRGITSGNDSQLKAKQLKTEENVASLKAKEPTKADAETIAPKAVDQSKSINSLPQGFFDDSTVQREVEEQLEKEQEKRIEKVDEDEWNEFEVSYLMTKSANHNKFLEIHRNLRTP